MGETETYGQPDIQRYLQHKMSQQEMHAFEKALMNDPFLADALEGFSTSDPGLVEEHLDEIEKSITGINQKAKVVPLARQKRVWWKVAAIVFIVISGGAITWSIVNNKNWFIKKNENIAVSTAPATQVENDSVRPVEKTVARLEIMPKKQLLIPRHNNFSPLIHDTANSVATAGNLNVVGDLENKTDGLIASSTPASATPNADLTSTTQMRFQRSASQNEFKGKVVDSSGQPIALANITTNANGVNSTSDVNGNFTLKTPDTAVDVTVKSPGYAAATTKIKSDKPDTKIVLKEDELSLAEVVVTALANKKKNPSPTIRIDPLGSAIPVGGWKNFEQYLSKKQDFIKGIESFQNLNEDFVLEFAIDKNGQPTNIKVPEEMDKATAEKTIEIISNGPCWMSKKKDKKVRVVIGF